jgi:hypothetical protein
MRTRTLIAALATSLAWAGCDDGPIQRCDAARLDGRSFAVFDPTSPGALNSCP